MDVITLQKTFMVKMRHLYFIIFFAVIVGMSSCLRLNRPFSNKLQDKYEPQENFFLARYFPDPYPSMAVIDDAFRLALNDEQHGVRTSGSWKVQGPGNIGARINTVAVHPDNHDIMLVGYSSGGMFKTVDGGNSWYPVFDDKAYTSVGSISFDPSNPNVVYAGTGDPNVSGYPFVGNGLYVSKDAGETWLHVGLSETGIISRVAIAPSNSQKMYVSAMGLPFYKSPDRGVYISNDGGKTWNKSLYINDSTGVSEVVIDPQNANTAYAIGWNRIRNNRKSIVGGPDAKIYKTTNGGQSWQILSNGLPEGEFTRMGLALSPANPQVLYAQYTSVSTFNLEAIYKSSDGGNSWSLLTSVNDKGLTNNMGGFGWYFGKLRVNPFNENDIFLLGVFLMRYNAVADTWEEVIPDDFDFPHSDLHDLVFAGEKMILATDGGLYSADHTGPVLWKDMENIPTTQFYRVGYNPFKPNVYYGGAQDNGTSAGNAEGINSWNRIFGADGFQPLFNYQDSNIFYVETQNGRISVTQDGGQNFIGANEGLTGTAHWDMQYIMSAFDPTTLYTGTQRVFKSEGNPVPLWVAISDDLTDQSVDALQHRITTLSESPLEKDILYVGTTDAQVWHSLDGGLKWTKINSGLPLRYISSIKASPSFKNKVYVSLTGYRDNDNTGHIYRSDNNGKNWIDISHNLPPFAINDILIYPNGSDDVLFAATDGGIYFTSDFGQNWERLGINMPYIPVYDIEYNPVFNQVIAGTFARSIQTFDLDQIGINLQTKTKDVSSWDWSVWPTVTHNAVQIKGNQEINVKIYNSQGVLVKDLLGNNEVKLEAYPSGVYYFKNGHKTQKVVKI